MQAKILSLNIGAPSAMEWQGKTITSSMHRHPVSGPLVVHKTHIEGNSFAAPTLHGVEHSVLYALGEKSALEFVARLGLDSFTPGSIGETVTLDDLDEKQVSVGDVIEFGEVLAQAVYPRIPCSKVNFRMQNEDGQRHLIECGRSGVYFRILRPGRISKGDQVKLIQRAKHRISIFDLYHKMTNGIQFDQEEMRLAVANGAFPEKALGKWRRLLEES